MNRHNRLLRKLLSQMESKALQRPIAYLAVPISSGYRLWQLAAVKKCAEPSKLHSAAPEEVKSFVIRPNINDAADALAAAERAFPKATIVNPAQLSIANWSQPQYRRAWKSFIEEFVDYVILGPKWEYSHGCVEEVTHALKLGKRVYTYFGEKLSKSDIEHKLLESQGISRQLGIRAQFVDNALKSLRNEGGSSLAKYGTLRSDAL